MFKEKPLTVFLFCAIVTICTGVLQFIQPNFSFFDSGLITVIMLTVFLKDDRYTIAFGVAAIVLVFVATFYEHEGMSNQQIIMQHLFSAIIILLAVIAVLYVKKLYRAMEGEQLQLNALFEFATEGILLTNKKGEIILVNPAGANLFKYTKEEMIGKKVEDLIPKRFTPNHDKYRDHFHAAPSNRSMGHGRDLYALDKNGVEFPVEISLSHYKLQNESYVIAFVIDITQRKEAEKRMIAQREELERVSNEIRILNSQLENKVKERTLILQEALQELERSQQDLSEALSKEKELSEIKSRFVSMASHEFRTPLSSILSSASLIGKYQKEEEQANRDRHITKIKDSVKHLNDLLEDFLSLGRLEEGRIEATLAPFEMKEFLEDVMEEMKVLLKDGIKIQAECSQFPAINSDKKLVKNILINLISNAIKFSNPNSTVTIGAFVKDQQLHLSVADQGIGISKEDQQHLFTSFFRGRNVENIQGTGLGLHIVKRYVDLLKGEVQLESELEKGTTIRIIIPV
ncbi:PAS domain-containing sensor histidine kinase [Paraflavitalea sp. sgz302552]|uniref:sensor histidine kinase n=1 Tax=Paraflavitalea sp. sgz302552 TaxID=3423908 RepID=UPI003D324E61